MAYNSPTLQKLLTEFNETSIVIDFQKLYTTTRKTCVEPDLEYIKSIDNTIGTLLYENLRYVQYIIYSLYNSEYLKKFTLDLGNTNKYHIPGSCYLLMSYNTLIKDIIDNNVEHIIMDKSLYIKYIDKLKEVNNNICILCDRIKNNRPYTNIPIAYLNLFNIYEHNIYNPLSQNEIDNFITLSQQNNQEFLFFSVNKKTKKLDYIIKTGSYYVNIIDNNKIHSTYIENRNVLSNFNFKPITVNGLYNTKFELLQFPEDFIYTYNDIFCSSSIKNKTTSNFKDNNKEYLDLLKYNVYVLKLNKFNVKHTDLNSNNLVNGFYNYKNIRISNNFNFNNDKPFITSNSLFLIKCKLYIQDLEKYISKIIKDTELLLLFYNEINKLLDNITFVDKQHTFKYPGQLYSVINIINNIYIKLLYNPLEEIDIKKIVEKLQLYNTKLEYIRS